MKKIMVIFAVIALCVTSFPVAVFGDDGSDIEQVFETSPDPIVDDGESVDEILETNIEVKSMMTMMVDSEPDDGLDDTTTNSPIIISRINTKNGSEFIQLYNNSGADIDFESFSAEWFNSVLTSQGVFQKTQKRFLANSFVLFKQGGSSLDSDVQWGASTNKITPNGGKIVVELNGEVLLNTCWGGIASSDNTCTENLALSDSSVYANDNCIEACALPGAETKFGGIVDIDTDSGSESSGGNENMDMCEYISLNEISFSEPEKFIEIVNTTKVPIDLSDCTLRRGTKDIFMDGELSPGEIKSFDVMESDLTQTNSSVSIYIRDLIQKKNVVTVAYKAKAGTSYAWLVVNGVEDWHSTYAPTPGQENIYQQFQTCEVGKHINVATGNCVKDPDPPAECAENQYRNPATGRCKKLDSDKSLAECAAGQFRNPATNRCKKIASGDELNPCAEGWERNPETNRCRKIPIGSEAAYAVSPFDSSGGDGRMWIWIGAAGAAAIGGLIAWQFRPEITRFFGKVFSKAKK